MINTGLALASISNQDGIGVQGVSLHNPAPTPMSLDLADFVRPQVTDGKVSESGIAVGTSRNEDGVSLDYYTMYKGSGSIADGWPSKSSWISFADMYIRPHLYQSCKQHSY